MMQRDQQLQQQMAASAYQPPAQPAPVPETTEQPETAPAPPPVEPPVEQPAEVTVNYFYDNLAPYGTWINVDGYGRCWRPSVAISNPGWQPYCDLGHWVYTDCGWYWFSDYSWGWAPFHYGRWFRHSHWGWCWAPDTVWGPSWVTWRSSDDYCGWAPLPPLAVYREGVGFFYNGLAVSVGFDFGLNWNCFAFVPIGHFCDRHPRRYCVASAQVTQIYNHTTVINNFGVHNHNFVNHGIDPEHIAAVTRTPIHPISIRDAAFLSGHGPHGDQLSHDGRTLDVNRPHFVDHPVPGEIRNNHSMPFVSPAQNHSLQLNGNQPPLPTRKIIQPQVPVVTTHSQQEGNTIHVPMQPLPPPANYKYSSPAPNYDNRTISPRRREQLQSLEEPRGNMRNSEAPVATPAPNQWPHNVPEVSHQNAPAAEPVEHTQHSESSLSPRSSGQNQNQNNSGNNSNNGPGNGSGRGPGH
jgi:hypothetical protein